MSSSLCSTQYSALPPERPKQGRRKQVLSLQVWWLTSTMPSSLCLTQYSALPPRKLKQGRFVHLGSRQTLKKVWLMGPSTTSSLLTTDSSSACRSTTTPAVARRCCSRFLCSGELGVVRAFVSSSRVVASRSCCEDRLPSLMSCRLEYFTNKLSQNSK